jgi:hypothetical protein
MFSLTSFEAPPNFSKDPKVGPRGKQWNKKRVGACSLIDETFIWEVIIQSFPYEELKQNLILT